MPAVELKEDAILTDPGNPDPTARVAEACGEIRAAMLALGRGLERLERAVETEFEAAFKRPFNREEALADHRRNHRSGTPSKIATDPELRAFILARLDTETLTQIVAAVATHFPPDRRISLSSLSRWWAANRLSLINRTGPIAGYQL